MSSIGVDEDWARRLGRLLARIPLETVYRVEERDPQYRAVLTVVQACGPRGVALVVGNALVSYRLAVRGEEYWTEFAKYFREHCRGGEPVAEMLARFLGESRGNRFLREQKKRRLARASGVLEDIGSRPQSYQHLPSLVRKLAAVLGARGDEKTILFAAKMAYYSYRALGLPVTGVEEIGIPIDRRIAFLTASSALLSENCVEKILSTRRGEALRAWRIVSGEAGIPLLNLDSLLWLPLRGPDKLLEKGLVGEARRGYAENLVRYSGGEVEPGLAWEIAVFLLYRRPRARC